MRCFQDFDFVVVGRGLMGAACARHLSRAGASVCMIGPAEPSDKGTFWGPFASHHDQGRITRGLAEDADWSRLALRSMAYYDELGPLLGNTFYHPVGVIMAGPEFGEGAEFTRAFFEAATVSVIAHHVLDETGFRENFSFLNLSSGSVGAFEQAGGWINPRDYRRAMELDALRHGAVVVDDWIVSKDGSTVKTFNGQRFCAGQFILATGAYGHTSDWVGFRADMDVFGRTVLLAQVSPSQAQALGKMPSVIYLPSGVGLGHDLYVLPPIRYPDGQYYVKIGGEYQSPQLRSDADMAKWFHSKGSAPAAAVLEQHLRALLPQVNFKAFQTAPCAVSFTKTGFPYIDRVAKDIILVTGGNGAAAKSSDEIGRLAANLALGRPKDHAYSTDFHAVMIH